LPKVFKKRTTSFFEGRIQTRSWEGQDGQKRYRTEIVAENMQMGPRVGEASTTAPKEKSSDNEEIPIIDADEEEKVNVDDIPF